MKIITLENLSFFYQNLLTTFSKLGHKHDATDITQNTTNRFVSDAEKATWDAKSNFSGNYVDLTNKPTIPSAYTLPIASATVLGGVKVGAGLAITSGVLSASTDWSTILNKPSVFTPSSHTHTISDLPTGSTSTSLALGNHVHSGVYEPVISTKNSAFNVNFDTTATNIKMDGTQSLGTLGTVARADHVHPSDTSKVSTSTTVNSKALTDNITLTLDDIANGSTRSLANYSLSSHNHDTSYSPLTHTHATYVEKVTNMGLSSNDYTTAEKTKLTGIETGANNYVHPSTHPATIITQTSAYRFVTDTEKATWNAKSSFSGSYADLTNKPTIPSKVSELSNDKVFLTETTLPVATELEITAIFTA